MAKTKNNPRIKSKTVEVSARSWFGKSEMDKTIEKYTNDGWQLVQQNKIPNKNRYTLRFEYELSDEEFAVQQRRQRNANIGCLVIFLGLGILALFSGEEQKREEAAENARQVAVQATQNAEAVATDNAQSTLDANATATATLWTPTPTLTPTETLTPSNTPSPSDTPTITNTPTTTNTPSITPSATITNTPLPTSTKRPDNTPRPMNTTQPSTRTYYIIGNTVNARSCPRTDCDIVTALSRSAEIEVIETVQGASVSGSTNWYQVQYNGREVYVHSSLASRTRPAQSAPVATAQTSNSGNTANIQNQPVVPSPVPNIQNESVAPPPAPASACNCSAGDTLNCSNFNSQAAAQACHNQCVQEVGRDVHGLDGNDGDGLACESL